MRTQTDTASHAKRATPRKTTATAKGAAPRAQEATALLRADHRAVDALFKEYDSARSAAHKQALVAQICTALKVHTQIEEEIFYPAVQKALKDTELVPEAKVEHETLKRLIQQVEGVAPGGDMFDARIQVMSEYVKHHVREEQNEMFPKAKRTDLDLKALGARMAERKAELMADMRQAH